MTRVEMRELRKKQFRRRMIAMAICCLLFFLLGIFVHWCICKSSHEDIQRVEVSGSVTVHTEPDSEVTVDTSTTEIPKAGGVVNTLPPVEETEPEVTEFVSYYDYTGEELDLLARLIYSEGGTESYETKLKIGSVVMNRVSSDDPYFPDTIWGVIYQKNQFSVTTYKINGVTMIDRPADEESIRAAKEVLDYGSVLPLDVQVFYGKGCKESWVTSRKKFGTFDNTVFAYYYAG